MTCCVCGNLLAERDHAAYGSRCEDCWTGDAYFGAYRAAELYAKVPRVEDIAELTNQGLPLGMAHSYRNERRRK